MHLSRALDRGKLNFEKRLSLPPLRKFTDWPTPDLVLPEPDVPPCFCIEPELLPLPLPRPFPEPFITFAFFSSFRRSSMRMPILYTSEKSFRGMQYILFLKAG